ncbi:hypothetical protein [Mariniblastus fucicola]|uniref:Condensation domain protein n=1 Tax=Mariniblastus fucicola TaxID=980251 RepID=A0A5B9PD11_9BACT|nr:hypothetical protein [Mariniblastus fucicola]QEG24248.1 Condensation domain protein [Mariniblastus fucicola]
MSDQQSFPLSAFEELFLYRDHPDAPSSFFVKFQLNSHLDRAKAQQSIDKVCEHHVLASSRIEVGSNGKSRWVHCPRRIEIQWFENEFEEAGYPQPWFDPEKERPLRVHCYSRPDSSSTMLFHVHHVAFDGLGFLQLFQDWWRIYCGKEPAGDYDQNQLLRRCRPSVSVLQAVKLLPGQWKSVRATVQVLGRKVIPLLGKPIDSAGLDPVPAKVITRCFDRQTSADLRKCARDNRVSTNSLLARNLYVAIDEYQTRHRMEAKGSHLRLAIPFNERNSSSNRLSACNHCTVISFDRSRDEVANPATLLHSVDQEVRVVQRWRLSLNFWRVLGLFRRLPGGIARFGSPQNVTATTLFSNLGRLDRGFEFFDCQNVDGVAVTEVEVVPTMHRGMPIAIVVYEYSGQVRFSMQYDPRSIAQADAERFVDAFFDTTRRLLPSA